VTVKLNSGCVAFWNFLNEWIIEEAGNDLLFGSQPSRQRKSHRLPPSSRATQQRQSPARHLPLSMLRAPPLAVRAKDTHDVVQPTSRKYSTRYGRHPDSCTPYEHRYEWNGTGRIDRTLVACHADPRLDAARQGGCIPAALVD